ncbi:MAG: ribosome silencing factor [bacterium]
MSLRPLEVAKIAAQAAEEKKSKSICILDLRKISPIADYFVICSVMTQIQAKAVADHVLDELAENGVDVWHVEGYENARWILLDYVDVVMHVFEEETRSYYGLDRLWGDAPQIELGPPAARSRKK